MGHPGIEHDGPLRHPHDLSRLLDRQASEIAQRHDAGLTLVHPFQLVQSLVQSDREPRTARVVPRLPTTLEKNRGSSRGSDPGLHAKAGRSERKVRGSRVRRHEVAADSSALEHRIDLLPDAELLGTKIVFQGVVHDPYSASVKPYSVTNAVTLEVK